MTGANSSPSPASGLSAAGAYGLIGPSAPVPAQARTEAGGVLKIAMLSGNKDPRTFDGGEISNLDASFWNRSSNTHRPFQPKLLEGWDTRTPPVSYLRKGGME